MELDRTVASVYCSLILSSFIVFLLIVFVLQLLLYGIIININKKQRIVCQCMKVQHEIFTNTRNVLLKYTRAQSSPLVSTSATAIKCSRPLNCVVKLRTSID